MRLITHFEPGNLLVFEDGNLVAADLRAATRRDYGRSEIDRYPGTSSLLRLKIVHDNCLSVTWEMVGLTIPSQPKCF
ncbi:MAG: hypothetical protein CMI15_05915 [Opitutaceae bacterium]|nr:hypothetical protein [Opitutaceae bacterium]